MKESGILLSRKFFNSFLLCHGEMEKKNKGIRFMFLERILKPCIARLARQLVYNLIYIGNIHGDAKNPAKAMGYYQEALQFAEASQTKLMMADILLNIGISYREQKNYARALEYADLASEAARRFKSLMVEWQVNLLRGRVHRDLNKPEVALQAFSEATVGIEKLREQAVGSEQERQRLFDNKSEPYDEIIELLVAQKKTAEALAYAERFRGRVLLDTLEKGKINVSKAMSAQEQEKERRIQSELTSLNSQFSRASQKEKPNEAWLKELQTRLQKIRHEFEDFQFQLYATHPELKTQRGEIQPLTLEDASRLLPEAGSALLEFVVKDDKSYLFVITKTLKSAPAIAQPARQPGSDIDMQVYPLNIKQKELETLTQSFVNAVSKRSASYKESASQLYNTLLKPAQTQLRNLNNLIIVPDDVLWELPFQALQSSANRFLVQDYAISYAPSLTVLREMSKKRRNRQPSATATLLALGNPDIGKETRSRVEPVYMDGQLTPLPEAERQVKGLAQLYGAGQSKTYIGNEAKEERLKQEAGHYRILHLATHGILNNTSPMYSHLVLSQSPGAVSEDGLLEAWEIMNLDLDAELAVLSACDTARGKVSAGEGVIGLSWSLFVAGCPSAAVSQWKVESSSTTELMLEFHRRLKGGVPKVAEGANGKGEGSASRQSKQPSSKSEALRQASLKLLKSKEYGHPFYWAGFIVVGDNSWH